MQLAPSRTPVVNELIYRVVLDLNAPGDGMAESRLDAAVDTELQCLDRAAKDFTGRPFRKLTIREPDDITFEADRTNGFTGVVTQDIDGERHAIRISVPDPAIDRRLWITNLCVFLAKDVAVLDLQLHCNSIQVRSATPRRVPELFPKLVEKLGLRDIRSISAEAWAVTNDAESQALVAFLQDPRRRLPVIVVSEPSVLRADYLAKTLFGVAHLVSLGSDAAHLVSTNLGQGWGCYGGAVRTYRARFNQNVDAQSDHPFASTSAIMRFRDAETTGPAAFMTALIERTYRALINGLQGIPVHDTLWVRREHAGAAMSAPTANTAPVPPIREATPKAPEIPVSLPAKPTVLSEPLVLTVQIPPELASLGTEISLLREELEASRDRAEDAEIRAVLAEQQLEQLQNEQAQLLSEHEKALIEIEFLRPQRATDQGTLSPVRLPGAKMLLSGVDALMHGVQSLFSDIRAIEDELDSKSRALHSANAQAERRAEAPADAAPAPALSYDDPIGFEQFVEERYAGRLLLHPRALGTWKDGEYEDMEHLVQALDLLGNDLYTLRTRSVEDEGLREAYQDRLAELYLRDTPSISESELGRYREQYEVMWHDRVVFVDRHLRAPRAGNTTDPKRVLAIYYFWDAELQAVVVTALPGHARNRMTP